MSTLQTVATQPTHGFGTPSHPLRHNADYGDVRDRIGPQQGLERLVADGFLAAYSGHTAAAYRRDLTDYIAFCRHRRIEPLAATRADIATYLQTLRDLHRTPATIARRLVALRGFYSLAVTEYGMATSPAERIRIRRPRSQSRISALTGPELSAFLAAADRSRPRTAALAWLLATTGLRISEACHARRRDISLAGNSERWLDVICKNTVRRSVPLHPDTWNRILALPEDQEPLFATRTGQPLDRHAAARNLAAAAEAAGIATRFSPHVLRHTFVTLARQAGCPLEDVQEAAGHADPATTRRYDRTQQAHRDHPAHKILLRLISPDGQRLALVTTREPR